ncbi:MAG: GNAT family N-acetyltransferase [Dehalococcoidia bacterium]|nr:GNAT family N-acetyltransferase [Dehalococcoidia bacterium]
MSPTEKVDGGRGATNGISTRTAAANDAAPIAMLLTELNETVGVNGLPAPECYAPEQARVSPEQARRRMERMQSVETVLIAEVDGAAAGFTALRIVPYLDQDAPYAEITQMHVRPEFRRQRVGAALIEAAEAMAKAAGATCVHIITGNNNVTAQDFYVAVGYEQVCFEFEKFFEMGDAPHA